MLDLHEIVLQVKDRQMLQKLCQTRASQIKYKDALALIHYSTSNDLNSVGMPFSNRPTSDSAWILQIPKQRGKSNKRVSLNNADSQSQRGGGLFLDSASMVSNMTYATDVSIDPMVRHKAEKILDRTGQTNHQRKLDVISEEVMQSTLKDGADAMNGEQSVRLTAGKLKDFESSRGDGVGEQDFMFGGRSKTEMNGHHNSLRDKLTARAQKLSKFDEKSMLDQDDSYGNYRPKFQTKKL